MPDPKDDKSLPPTAADLEKRIAALEEKRDQAEGLTDDEIQELRRSWKGLKKEEGEPATEQSFLDWLFS